MEAGGIEPTAKGNNDGPETHSDSLPASLAPDLLRIVTVWPDLSEPMRIAVLSIISIHEKGLLLAGRGQGVPPAPMSIAPPTASTSATQKTGTHKKSRMSLRTVKPNSQDTGS